MIARRLPALVAACCLAGCAGLPRLGGGGEDEVLAAVVLDRVWLEGEGGIPGTARAWTSSGQMLAASCWATPRIGTWRWTGVSALEWTEADARVRAEVAAAGPDELVLLIGEGDAPRTLRLRAAREGSPC